jgi:hypothetical protein
MASEAETALLPRCKTLSIKEALSLADRLRTRSTSIVLRDQPDLCEDLALAAKTIRGMSNSFQTCDLVRIAA